MASLCGLVWFFVFSQLFVVVGLLDIFPFTFFSSFDNIFYGLFIKKKKKGYFLAKISSMDNFEIFKFGGPCMIFNHYLEV